MLSSFSPIVDENCRILILGTMPGPESLRKQEYYGNKRNAFWEIIYSLFGYKLNDDYRKKKEFVLKHKVALWDVLKFCDREGSGDANIKNPVPNDFKTFLVQYYNINTIFFNGKTACNLFKKFAGSKADYMNISFYTLPSTSPANAVKFEDKLLQWRLISTVLERLD